MNPGPHSVTVPIPSREWALVAIEDLRGEGLSAALEGQDAAGNWLLRIDGPAYSIGEIRHGLQPLNAPVCWESFVNAACGDPTERASEGW